jgi:hypothetical protein
MNKLTTGLVALAMIVSAGSALAQDAAPQPKLAIELNAVQPVDGGCRVTFLATNGLGSQLDRAAVEMALFKTDGGIDRIVTLDFKGLTADKTKVLQFQLSGLDCAALGRVLINDITACEGEALAADACLAALVTSARPDIAFGV